ncbi:serine:pyruvate alanine:glyoxylate aminotransferase [Cystoisospora suis]|uniref:Serine:pyruvate alanine:glyoxylate aminotransferase n=1 Tax=Cystoisospora suis TaxID=483139 RepID=A0A2C6KRH4_9APIC|nr:serine:pyruvate alanine:glyoxylate aminotransferase [Cystoisospora suis]
MVNKEQSKRTEVPRGFKTSELYYIEEDTEGRIRMLAQQKKQPGPSSQRRKSGKEGNDRAKKLRLRKAQDSADADQLILCDAALKPPLCRAVLTNPKVSAFLKHVSTYGVCPSDTSVQTCSLQSFSSPPLSSVGSPGCPVGLSRLPANIDPGQEATLSPKYRDDGRTVSHSGNSSQLISPRYVPQKAGNGAPVSMQSNASLYVKQSTGSVTGSQARSQTLSRRGSSARMLPLPEGGSPVRKLQSSRQGSGTYSPAGLRGRPDLKLSISGVGLGVPPLPVVYASHDSWSPPKVATPSQPPYGKDACGRPVPMRKVKGAELVKGQFVFEKQIADTAARKLGLLEDLQMKTAALRQTNKKLGQRQLSEIKLQKVEQLLGQRIAEAEQPLLAQSFHEFQPDKERTQTYLLQEQQICIENLNEQPQEGTNKEDDSRQDTTQQGDSGDSGTSGSVKKHYVAVIDLATDMDIYLPDIREELCKLVQKAMLKQHSVFNLIKLGNKVDSCFGSMPRRVDEHTIVSVDKFIRSLAKSNEKPGTTDLPGGLRKAMLMKPDVVYLISHTAPANPSQQEECLKLVQEYFQLSDSRRDGRRDCWRKPPELRYIAFRNPLSHSSSYNFFWNLCLVAAGPQREHVADSNFLLADREALWRAILKDATQAKKLRAKLKVKLPSLAHSGKQRKLKTSQMAATYDGLRKVVPELREKLHVEVAVEKLLQLDQKKVY